MTEIEISSLHQRTLDIQRMSLDEAQVRRYMRQRAWPPVTVYENQENGERILVNGHHRVEAARRLGRLTVEADVTPGDRVDAHRYWDQR